MAVAWNHDHTFVISRFGQSRLEKTSARLEGMVAALQDGGHDSLLGERIRCSQRLSGSCHPIHKPDPPESFSKRLRYSGRAAIHAMPGLLKTVRIRSPDSARSGKAGARQRHHQEAYSPSRRAHAELSRDASRHRKCRGHASPMVVKPCDESTSLGWQLVMSLRAKRSPVATVLQLAVRMCLPGSGPANPMARVPASRAARAMSYKRIQGDCCEDCREF